jgi:hypothetical protein
MAKRIQSADREPLRHLRPLEGLFSGFDSVAPSSFPDAVNELHSAVRDGRVPLNGLDSPERRAFTVEQMQSGSIIAFQAATDIKKFKCQSSPLSHDQIAAIHYFTQETDQQELTDSVYALINSVLRNENRDIISNIPEYIWLLMTALCLCPSSPVKMVYRAVKGDLAKKYLVGREITWYQVSSCSITADNMFDRMFLGDCGNRVIFSIELKMERIWARLVSPYSANAGEDEVILPPNSVLKVR